jgi:hypothetical protein
MKPFQPRAPLVDVADDPVGVVARPDTSLMERSGPSKVAMP